MRKLLFVSTLFFGFFSSSFSQVNVNSLGFNYSALVRDTAGRVQPLKAVKLRFTLLLGQNGTTANSPWIETQSATTDAYGFVNVTIGNGTKAGGTSATFSAVDFSLTNYWILIQVYNTFTQVFDPLAKQALQAVPYAKVAGSLVGGSAIPAGTIVAFGGDTTKIPDGWLLCNGRTCDNTDPKYIALFNAIQYNWGTTNHTNLFDIPFCQGLFLRGAQNGNGYDPDVSSRTSSRVGGNVGDNVGSFQYDMYANHNHGIQTGGDNVIDDNPGGLIKARQNADGRVQTYLSNFAGGNETRPRNVYVNYIIKL